MTQKSGIFQGNFKAAIRPQDDMYRHVNGGWLDTSEIPSDRAADGAFYFLRDESEKNVRTIIEELAKQGGPAGSNAQKIGDLYADFMDEEQIEKLGIAPIADDLARAQAITSLEEFTALLGKLEAKGLGGLLSGWVTPMLQTHQLTSPTSTRVASAFLMRPTIANRPIAKFAPS